MGVGFQVGGEHFAGWSYSGFNEFRARLAKEIGINIYEMHGFFTHDEMMQAYDVAAAAGNQNAVKELFEKAEARRPWEEINDPIVPLLHHSDCDGELSPEECVAIAPRLRQLISNWPDKVTARMQGTEEQIQRTLELGYKREMELDDYDKVQGLLLAKGMERSVETGEPLLFC